MSDFRKMNTPTVAIVSPGVSRPETPVDDLPSMMDLPSALTSSDHPLLMASKRPNEGKICTPIYELPDLSRGAITPPPSAADKSTQLVVASTAPPAPEVSQHFEPAPGVHVRVLRDEASVVEDRMPQQPVSFPKLEIFLEIDAGAPAVNMDVKASRTDECVVHVRKLPSVDFQKRTSEAEVDEILNRGYQYLMSREPSKAIDTGTPDEMDGPEFTSCHENVSDAAKCSCQSPEQLQGNCGFCHCQPPCEDCIKTGCRFNSFLSTPVE